MTRPQEFRKELESLINRFSAENGSNTPDFLLAEYLHLSLLNFDMIVNAREKWYGRKNESNAITPVELERLGSGGPGPTAK